MQKKNPMISKINIIDKGKIFGIGYRQNSSTETSALELIDRILGQLDQRDIPINFYLDLSKAFDCINHKSKFGLF